MLRLSLAMGVALVLGACTNDYDFEFASSGNTGGGGTGAAGAGGGGTGGAAGTGAGGSVSGQVSCAGTNDCDLSNNFCCIRFDGAQCIAQSADCSPGTDVECDGPEDCPGDQVCCGQLGPTQSFYTSIQCASEGDCRSNNNRRVFCGDDASVCPNSTTCEASSLLPQFKVCSPN